MVAPSQPLLPELADRRRFVSFFRIRRAAILAGSLEGNHGISPQVYRGSMLAIGQSVASRYLGALKSSAFCPPAFHRPPRIPGIRPMTRALVALSVAAA